MSDANVCNIPPEIALLTGPILLGNLFGFLFYGILIVQLFLYYHRFPNDPWVLQALVWFTFLVDTLGNVFHTIASWNLLADGWGHVERLGPVDWPFGPAPLLTQLVALCVQSFFCWRIYKLRRLIVLPIIIELVALLSFAMASYSGLNGLKLGLVGLHKEKPFVITWLIGSTVVDFVIAASMVIILVQAQNKTIYASTRSMLRKLITLTVETGVVTGLGALSELILYLIFPENNMHFLPFLMLAKLYSNTLLAALNARSHISQDSVLAPPLWNNSSLSLEHDLSTGFSSRIPGITGLTGLTESDFVSTHDIELSTQSVQSRSNSVQKPSAKRVHKAVGP